MSVDLAPPGPALPPQPNRKSGYYNVGEPYGQLRSVTTILEQINKGALPHWYASQVATCAIEHLPYLSRLRGRPAREAAFTWLRMAAERKKTAAGDLGSAIHRHAEAKILGTPMPEPSEEEAPFIRALDRFLDEWKPSYEATELVVARPEDGWCGTCDGFVRFRGLGLDLAVIDYKTGRGVWGEAPLQLAAYNRATVAWTKNGIEVEPPHGERGFVIHLRPDRYASGYAVLPVDIGDESYAQFLAAKRLDDGAAHRRKAVGAPLDPPPLPDLPDLSRKAS